MTKNRRPNPAPAPAMPARRHEPCYIMQDSWMNALQLVDPDSRWKLLQYARDYQLHGLEPDIPDPLLAIAFFFMKSEHNEEAGGVQEDHFLVRESWLGMFELLDEEARWELMEHVGAFQLNGILPAEMRPELQTGFYLLRSMITEGIENAGDVFILRAPWMEAFRKLPIEKRWHLMRYIMRYQRCGEQPDIEDQQIRMAFSFMQEELARLSRQARPAAEDRDAAHG